MSNDLRQALHDTTEQLTLDRPVTDNVARGSQLRRGRRRWALGGAAAVLAGVAALSVALPDGPVTRGVGILWLPDDVERLEVTVAGTTIEAAVHDGFAFFWLPDGNSQAAVEAATIVAYDAAGAELAAGNLLD